MRLLNRLGLIASLAMSALLMSGCSNSTDDPAPVPPTISAAPAAQSVIAGQPASFTVSATGSEPLSYQWQRNGVDVAGASAATYTLPATGVADNGALYLVKITNKAGTTTSPTVLLTVQPAVAASITAQPVGATVSAATATTFSVTAAGSAPITYQWQRDGVDIPGATSASYALAAPTVADSGAIFRVVVTNAGGSVTTAGVLLTVVSDAIAAPTISAQPQASSVLDGDPAVLSVAVAGTGPFRYQWRRNGTAIAGATGDTYTSDALTLADTGAVYSVVASNGGGSVTSDNATLTVNARPVAFTSQPAAASKIAGETASFQVVATGSDTKTFQWLKNGSAISGATAAAYTTPPLTTADSGAMFAARVTNPAGSVTSASALLTVTAAPTAPSIATQPASITVSEGQPAAFSVTASGTGTLSYQWRRNGTNIAGATAASFNLASTLVADNAARFSVVVSNSVGPVTSADAVLTVQAATGGLIGRAWAVPQSLEENTSTVSVLDRRAAIDDAGNVTVLFRKNNGTRDAIYAMRGTPNGAGQAPTWSTPVPIDVLAAAPVSTMGTQPDYSLTAAPGGDLVALWYHNAACTAATYRTSGTCRYYHYARYRVASNAWEAPVLLTDASDPGFNVYTNDRGDLVFFGNSWVRSGTTSSTNALALFMRGAGEAATRRQLLNAEPINAYQLGMDAAGNLLMAAQYQQNATTDLAAYRGTVTSGLGSPQFLDTRGSAATLDQTAVGLNGHQVITWTQNNGISNTTYAAASPTPTGSFAVRDLDRVLGNGRYLVVADDGQALYASLVSRQRTIWTAASGWGPWEAIPSATPAVNLIGRGFATNRTGDVLFYEVDNLSGSGGNTATYDARRNVVVLAAPTSSAGTAPGWVMGFRASSVGYGTFLLSTSGLGFTSLVNRYDTLPTVALPAGDGRAVNNLWGAFLK